MKPLFQQELVRSATENAIEIAKKLAQNFQLVGTLAVEMFLTNEGDLCE